MERFCHKPAPANDSRRGAAMLECAITLPVMLTLVLGTLEFGYAMRASTILQSACREAGRLASMDWRYIVTDGQTPNQKLEQDLRNFVTASGLPGSALTVTLTYAEGEFAGQAFDLSDTANDLEMIRIEVTLPYSEVSAFPLDYMGGKSIRVSTVMRAGINGGSLSN